MVMGGDSCSKGCEFKLVVEKEFTTVGGNVKSLSCPYLPNVFLDLYNLKIKIKIVSTLKCFRCVWVDLKIKK